MKELAQQYLSASPFPHLVIDDFTGADVLRAVSEAFDQVPAVAWHVYREPQQPGKRVCFNSEAMPPLLGEFVSAFAGEAQARQVSEWTSSFLDGPHELVGDASLWGAGLHVTPPGGRLMRHVDSEVHPRTGSAADLPLLRRVNAVLYCTPDWRLAEGGELELVGARGVARITPRFNRLVLFACGWRNYHGHALVRGSRERKSIAAFFWSPPRTRAQFSRDTGSS